MATMRDVVDPRRPNFTMPPAAPMPPNAPLMLEGPKPGTALMDPKRPNFTMPPTQPEPTPTMRALPAPGPQQMAAPGNPNVPKGGLSAEAQAFRAALAPTAPDSGWKNAWRSMRGNAAALGKASLPGVAGGIVGTVQRMADGEQAAPAPFVPPEAKPGDIPTDPTTQAPKPTQRRPLGFGPDNEFTRNVANTVNAVSGLGSGLGSGMRALGMLREGSGVANAAAKVAPAAQKIAPFVQGAQAAQAAQPLSAPNLTTPGKGADPSIGPPELAARRDGVIYREGNSYSGTGNIAFGAEIDNARNPGVGVTSLDFSEGRRQDAMELARMRAAAPQGPTMGGFAGGEQIGMAREGGTANFGPSLSVLGPSGNAMKPRDVRAANAIAAERATATERMANERDLARMREGGDMARANLNAGVQRENNAAQISATMRGQDITREGHMVTAQGNRMRMQYDMAKDQRDYTAQRADKGFEQGQQAIKDLHSEIGSMIPPTTDRDGKTVPDTENAARYATAMQSMVGRMGKTMKDVDAKDKARFVAGMQLADVASATATGGLTPWGTRAIQSNEPILALRKLPNGDYQTNRVGVNGETEVIPGRYIEKEGSTLGFGGRASNKFKALME